MQHSNIILWRHAQALPAMPTANNSAYEDDMARVLTAKGQHQAKQMARWLATNLPKNTVLYSSPALRAFQTAEAIHKKINASQALQPNANLQEVIEFLASIATVEHLLLVGHEPWLGQLAAHLLGFSGAEISIKKGAIWWLRLQSCELKPVRLIQKQINVNQINLYKILTVQTPKYLPEYSKQI